MADRVKVLDGKQGGGSYFAAPTAVECFSSGCVLLDCVLGGGWARGRFGNVVGDKSTGKTLLMIEACANFSRKYKRGKIRYREVEAAFDKGYAGALGLPLDRVDFGDKPCYTVEDVFADMEDFLDELKDDEPGLYVLDSLDPLSTQVEMDRALGEASYGAEKAKMMSELFRKIVQRVEEKNVTVLIVSQVRDNIGVTFGRGTTRSGGKALDFYSSQIIYLSQVKKLERTKNGITRKTGVKVRVMCDKNKVGLPFRECEFDILFGYGIDDMGAALDFFKQVKALDRVGLTASSSEEKASIRKAGEVVTRDPAVVAHLKFLFGLPPDEFKEQRKAINLAVREVWAEIERDFLPERTKY